MSGYVIIKSLIYYLPSVIFFIAVVTVVFACVKSCAVRPEPMMVEVKKTSIAKPLIKSARALYNYSNFSTNLLECDCPPAEFNVSRVGGYSDYPDIDPDLNNDVKSAFDPTALDDSEDCETVIAVSYPADFRNFASIYDDPLKLGGCIWPQQNTGIRALSVAQHNKQDQRSWLQVPTNSWKRTRHSVQSKDTHHNRTSSRVSGNSSQSKSLRSQVSISSAGEHNSGKSLHSGRVKVSHSRSKSHAIGSRTSKNISSDLRPKTRSSSNANHHRKHRKYKKADHRHRKTKCSRKTLQRDRRKHRHDMKVITV